jgi:FixJ family two-component response regulator
MPHMLGREVADRLAGCRPGIRILFMSGYAHPVLASQGTLDVGVALIDKPFTEEALLAKIHEVLHETAGATAACPARRPVPEPGPVEPAAAGIA